MGNKQAYAGFGFRGLAVIGGVVIPHLIRLKVNTTYSVQENIKRYFSAGVFSIPYDKVRKVDLGWFGFSPMLLVKLGAASAAAGGNAVHEQEEQIVATQTITLDNPPLPAVDWALSLYEMSGGEPSTVYLPVADTPAEGEFTIDKTTGIITLGGTVAEGTKLYADYLEDQATDGFEVVLSDTFAAAALGLVGFAGEVNFEDGSRGAGSIVIDQTIPLGEPPISLGTGEMEENAVELSCKSNPVIHFDL